jgi:hypothetical protein
MQTPSDKLAEARSSLHLAAAAADDPDYRRQHAHHASTLAADVAISSDSSPEQKRTAALYLDQALAMKPPATQENCATLSDISRRRSL